MNQSSRTVNVIKNMVGGVGGQIFSSIIQFISRTYFIKILGAEYLGINGLFSNILSMLSLAELGIGPAIVFSMYKPIADNDELHIAKLMNFYKSAYRVVAIAVAVIGISIVPFLDLFIKGTTEVEYLKVIYILILSNTVSSYLLAYKGSIFNADQKSYVVVLIRNIFAVVHGVLQVLILLATHSYLLYLTIGIVTTLGGNILQAWYANKKYPFLVKYKNEKIDKIERKSIFKRVQGMIMHKFGGFILNGTDNMILSKFVGIIAVGLYSNYLMIIRLVQTYVGFFSRAMSSSVGNLIAKETEEKSHDVFNAIFLMYFWMYALCTVAMWTIFTPFIKIWIGDEFLIPTMVLFIVILNFFTTGLQECINTFTNATGLFWETRFKPIAECVINLGVSIVLAQKIGMIGVFLGTLTSFACTFWINPVVLYKKHFKRSCVGYFTKFTLFVLLTIITALITNYLCDLISTDGTVLNVALRVFACVFIPNIIFLAVFFWTKEFKYCFGIVKNILKRGKKQ